MAAITGNQLLLQNFAVANDTENLSIHFSYAVSTTETLSNTDRFCVSLAPVSNPNTVLADVGCWDANNVAEFARDGKSFDTFGYSIPNTLVKAMHGQTVTLVIALIQNASKPTTLSWMTSSCMPCDRRPAIR